MKKFHAALLAICISIFILFNAFNSMALDSNYIARKLLLQLHANPVAELREFSEEKNIRAFAELYVGYLDGKHSMNPEDPLFLSEMSEESRIRAIESLKEDRIFHERIRSAFDTEKKFSFGITAVALVLLLILGRDRWFIGLALIGSSLLNLLVSVLAVNSDFNRFFLSIYAFFTHGNAAQDFGNSIMKLLFPPSFFAGMLFDVCITVIVISMIQLLIGGFMVFRSRKEVFHQAVRQAAQENQR